MKGSPNLTPFHPAAYAEPSANDVFNHLLCKDDNRPDMVMVAESDVWEML